MSERRPQHEGFMVALVDEERCPRGTGVYRPLGHPRDGVPRVDIERLQAGCECGWRSSHWTPLVRSWEVAPKDPLQVETAEQLAQAARPAGLLRWIPYTVLASERDEAKGIKEWEVHLDPLGLDPFHPSPGRLVAPVVSPEDAPPRFYAPVFGGWLTDQRRLRGYTVAELAIRCGVTVETIRGIERSITVPVRRAFLHALSAALGLSRDRVSIAAGVPFDD